MLMVKNREPEIFEAAYAVLTEKGYAGASMLAIAKAAKASNETLYRWYGDKPGLFGRIIEQNAEAVTMLLKTYVEAGAEPMVTIEALGPELLALLTSDRAIALNRAAAADHSGQLGAKLAEMGRGKVAPLIMQVFEAARENGDLTFDHPTDAVSRYLDLLVGDLQIRRATGTVPPLTQKGCDARAQRALRDLKRLMG